MTIRVDISDALANFKQLSAVPDQVAQDAYEYFRGITPIRTGNARRRTSLRDTTIVADYAYAQRLDQGYSSQNRAGMTGPTQKEIERLMRRYTGK